MTKFYRIKDTEIRKVVEISEDGTQTPIALIGKVRELLERHIISEAAGESLDYCMDRWLVLAVFGDDNLRQSITYETLADAKASIPPEDSPCRKCRDWPLISAGECNGGFGICKECMDYHEKEERA